MATAEEKIVTWQKELDEQETEVVFAAKTFEAAKRQFFLEVTKLLDIERKGQDGFVGDA